MDDPCDPWFTPEPYTKWTALRNIYQKWFPPSAIVLLAAWGLLLYRYRWHPPVGAYIAILAVVAFVVAIRPPESRLSKAVWLLVVIFLGLFEIHNLYRDRNEHDKSEHEARAREAEAFQDIGKGITRSITEAEAGFNATIKRSDVILQRSNALASLGEKTLAETTGGKSFPYVLMLTYDNNLMAHLAVCGSYAVHQVHVTIRDEDALDVAFKTPGGAPPAALYAAERGFPVIDFLSTVSLLHVLTTYPIDPKTEHRRFNLDMIASNGVFEELIRARRIKESGAGFSTATIIGATYFNGKRGIVLERIDRTFPKELLTDDKEWNDFKKLPRLDTGCRVP